MCLDLTSYTSNNLCVFIFTDLEDMGGNIFQKLFCICSDWVRKKRQQKSVCYQKDYRSSIVNTSIGISLSCRYEHYSVLSAIITNMVPFPGCGKELLF